ncbi:Gcd10p-domain-containing protein [Amanita rubescens]|nr:Gcd10p-domain-containing protein [Amanita rubescens]
MTDIVLSESHPSKIKTSSIIEAGDSVLIRLPNAEVRSVKINKNSTIPLGRFGSFHANELIGQPYGLTYELVERKLKVIPPRSIQEVEDTDATNEYINDGDFVQPLTLQEIQALKQSGVHASDIIQKQIETHANYSLKTEYSKEKYKKRKEAKYSKSFTTIEPTLYNVCNYWFEKDHDRIRDIRSDTISQILNLSNIRPGGRYIAVDDASGLVVAGILERLGGQGRLLTICDTDSPPAYPVLTHMNFKPEETKAVMSTLNWATADPDHTPRSIVVPPSELPEGEIRSERQRSRLKKRKTMNEALHAIRTELFSGEFDALIIASEYDPYSIIETLFPFLAGSASIVVYSPHVQILADLQNKLRALPQYLFPNVTEGWLRRYQVLPGRTHPLMAMSGSGGFILHTIKVFDDPDATSVTSHRQRITKKLPTLSEQQAESSAGQAGASSRTMDDYNYSGDKLMSDVTISQ